MHTFPTNSDLLSSFFEIWMPNSKVKFDRINLLDLFWLNRTQKLIKFIKINHFWPKFWSNTFNLWTMKVKFDQIRIFWSTYGQSRQQNFRPLIQILNSTFSVELQIISGLIQNSSDIRMLLSCFVLSEKNSHKCTVIAVKFV